ncbi:MAG: hypothetical protein K6T26_01030 [Alicyclobacillus sp.]|nr:hypothetical protein [Alicyclobacillus sp.]
MVRWIITIVVLLVLAGLYVWAYRYARKRQQAFEAQYNAAKERHEVFVLHKRIVRERPKTGWLRFIRVKNYQVVGRVNVSQAVRGIQLNRMQTVTFHTTKGEYDKIQPNHRYKMDIAGDYIGYVVAPPAKGKGKDAGKGKEAAKAKDSGTPKDAGKSRDRGKGKEPEHGKNSAKAVAGKGKDNGQEKDHAKVKKP